MAEEKQVQGEQVEEQAESELEVTRREFLRRAGMVSGLTAFGLLGADALLQAIIGRMQAVRGLRSTAGFVAGQARDMGLLSSALADIRPALCAGYATYCTSQNPWVCVPTNGTYNCTSFGV